MRALILFITLVSLGKIQAQADIFDLKYDLTVIYTPEIVNTRNISITVNDSLYFYEVDYSPKSRGTLSEDYSTIVVGKLDKKEYFSEILINRHTSELVENRFDRRGTKQFLSITEQLPSMDWEISDEISEIEGYVCRKATVTFRGRHYTAFFTDQIPIDVGPWKFNGLPGLIVMIGDKTNTYKWKLKRLSTVSEIVPLAQSFNKRREKFKNVTYKEFDENRINAKLDQVKAKKARVGRSQYRSRFGFFTDQWLEPTNEFRSETEFYF